ncbi:MAG: alkaline phosphatase family protein [Cytophagaceae bacterium]|nr:alkaline phosphatase family protein [Cytophagaceae bacterium]
MSKGLLPNFRKLVSNGCSGKVKTLQPSFSPMLWTSIATGKMAHKHGILGFVEPDTTSTSGVRAINSTSRTCKAIWNILSQQGLKSNVVGWWPSHPVEPINGVMVSNQFQKCTSDLDSWQVKEDSVHGIDINTLAPLRVHPSQIRENIILTYVPQAAKVDQEKDNRLELLQRFTAETLTVRNTALWLLDNTEWDFMAVYFNELDPISHRFMPFHPPQLQGISDELFAQYYNVVTAAYTLYDSILGSLLAKINDTTDVVVLSDHGFYCDNRRYRNTIGVEAEIALDHSTHGFLAFAGPSFKKGEKVYGATLLDITPTMLTAMGYAVGKDMDGKVLASVFNQIIQTEYIESWESIPGNSGMHSEEKRKNAVDEADAFQQLVDLGYIASPGDSAEEEMKKAKKETRYNLSVVYAQAKEPELALTILEELYLEDPADLRYNLDLIRLYCAQDKTERAREILAKFRKVDVSKLTDHDYLEGKILMKEGDDQAAIQLFEKSLLERPQFINLLLMHGYLCLKHYQLGKAEKSFLKIIEISPENFEAHYYMAMVCNKTNRYEEAIEYAMTSISLENTMALSHHQLGIALYKLEEYNGAAEVLENSLKINPGLSMSRNILITLYKEHLLDQAKYSHHHKILEETRQGEIVIVSGLPRSGTSMMMQLLKAGGLPVLSDDSMSPDESNPLGYLEYEPVKNSFKDISWMQAASGKVVKVVAPLLKCMTLKFNLKVIFMERDLHEVIVSQHEMLKRKGNAKLKSSDFDLRLFNTYQSILSDCKKWIHLRHNIEVLYVQHRDMIESPEAEIARINQFMEGALNEEAMKGIVNPSLYRTRSNSNQQHPDI